MNYNSLIFWWPKTKDLGIAVPRTDIVECDGGKFMAMLEGEAPIFPDDCKEIFEAADRIGYPLFLRSDLQSGKHGWKDTCYVESREKLFSHLLGVSEENALGACMFGPPFSAFVLREFLALEISFSAFYGEMPINRERRYFVNDGKIICHHPYWPDGAIEGHTKAEGWKEKLALLNEESAEEIGLLSDYALRVSAALPGFWSVDFARAQDGRWYLIDMALGGQSFHWEGCRAWAESP